MRLYIAEITTAIRVSFADRTNFSLLLGGMVLNNGFVLLMWFMFFAACAAGSVPTWHCRSV
jgi:hypothetical protein